MTTSPSIAPSLTPNLPPNAAAPSSKPLLFKALAIGLCVLILHGLFLWWSLSPRSPQQNSGDLLAELRLQRGGELSEQASGDLFVEGRKRQELTDTEVEAPEPEAAAAGDYALLAVLTIGSKFYALFDNGAEQQKLTLGDTLPGSGTITHIDRRQVKINNPKAKNGKQQFMLFPVLQPKVESDTELTSDAEIDKM